jgi:flagellin-like protein
MKLNELFTDDDAVSPVIGVILMVAITVILAAVIGTFVLGLGDQVQNNPPTTDFSFDEDSSGDVDITHTSGQPVQNGNVEVSGSAVSSTEPCASGTDAWPTEITAGDTCTLTNPSGSSPDLSGSGTILVTWESDDGSTSDTLAEYEYEP